MYDTSYLDMQHLDAGHIFFVLTRVFVRFQQACNLEASLHILWNSIGSLKARKAWGGGGGNLGVIWV